MPNGRHLTPYSLFWGADMGNDEMRPIGPWAIRLGPKLKRCLVASLLIVLGLAAFQTLMAVLAALGAFS